MTDFNCNRCNRTSWIAFALILAGVVLILNNFDILRIDIGDIWPLFFVLVGVAKLKSGRQEDKSGGWIFLIIGVAFTLANLNIVDWDIMWRFFWPLMLIGCGVAILMRHIDGGSRGQQTDSSKRVTALSVFGHNHRVVTADDFEGGSITTLFGEVRLDFSQATLAAGENVLDFLVMFGGAQVKVPPTWHVVIKTLPIFGGAEDTRGRAAEALPVEDRTLVLKGVVLFGGLRVKNA